MVSRSVKLKTIKRRAAAEEEGRLLGQYKAHSKKPLLESLKEHLGKAIDNSDPFDAFIITGLAYLGYDLFHDWRGALIGPLGYKLATTMGGTPPVSQIAGLSILASLGLVEFASLLPTPETSTLLPSKILEDEGKLPPGSYAISIMYSCPVGFHKETFGYRYHAWCIPNT